MGETASDRERGGRNKKGEKHWKGQIGSGRRQANGIGKDTKGQDRKRRRKEKGQGETEKRQGRPLEGSKRGQRQDRGERQE